MKNFVIFTYKELLKKFLGGRGAPVHCLDQSFFKRVFEECDGELGLRLMKTLLGYFLLSVKNVKGQAAETDNKQLDSEMSGADSEAANQTSPTKTASRSNHQRL